MALEGFRLDTLIRDLRHRDASRRLSPGLDNRPEDSRQETEFSANGIATHLSGARNYKQKWPISTSPS